MKMWVELTEDSQALAPYIQNDREDLFWLTAPHFSIFGALLDAVSQQPIQTHQSIQRLILLLDMVFSIWSLALLNHNFL